ncbi:hypothetical protein D3C71_152750 [compost metagenome]
MTATLTIYPSPLRPVSVLCELLNNALKVEGCRPSEKKVASAIARMLGCTSPEDLLTRPQVESLPDEKSPPHVKASRKSQYEAALQPFKLSQEAMGRVIDVVAPAGSKEAEYLWIFDHPKVPSYARELGTRILDFARSQRFEELRDLCFVAINDDPHWDFRQAAWEDDEARYNDWTGYQDSGLRMQLASLRLHRNHPLWTMMCLAFIICSADSTVSDDYRLFKNPTLLIQALYSKNPLMFTEALNRTSEHEFLMLAESFRQQAGAFLARARGDNTGDGSGVSFAKTRPWEPLGKRVKLWVQAQRSTTADPWVLIGGEGDFEMTTAQRIEPGYFWIAKAELVRKEIPPELLIDRPVTRYGKRNIPFHGKGEGGTIAFAISDDRNSLHSVFALADIHHVIERIPDEFGDDDDSCYHTVLLEQICHLPLTGAKAVICGAIADDLRTMMGVWERVLMPGSKIHAVVETYEGMSFGEGLQQILEFVLDSSDDGFAPDNTTISADVEVGW